jgi:CRP/FNR family transcriptional regulator, cyclic AMP receptor protein
METLEPLLASHPFFLGIDPGYLQLLLSCASQESFDTGQFLCHEDEEARKFLVIYGGRVSVEIFSARRGAVTIQTLGEGDVLGWLWFKKPYHWHLDARAVQITRVVSLEVACLMDLCERDPHLGYELMKRYAHSLAVQFRAAKLQMLDMYRA